MSREQIAFAIAMALVPLALFLIMVSLACIRVFVACAFPENRITRLLLVRVDRSGYGQSGGTSIGSGRGDFWGELTQEFRALYK